MGRGEDSAGSCLGCRGLLPRRWCLEPNPASTRLGVKDSLPLAMILFVGKPSSEKMAVTSLIMHSSGPPFHW